MNRRRLLCSVSLPIFFPFSGCIGDDPRFGSTEDQPDSGEGNGDEANGTTDGADDEDEGRADEPPIAEQFDCTDAYRLESDAEAGIEHEVEINDETTGYESVGSTEYPASPAAFDDDAVRSFIVEHETAYQRHEYLDKYGDRLVEFDATIEDTELFHFHDGITTVRVDFAVHHAAISDGTVVMTEPAGEAAVYALDETGLVRTETVYRGRIDGSIREATPDPLGEGTILVCF